MAKNTTASFGLGNRIPSKPVVTEAAEEKIREDLPVHAPKQAPLSPVQPAAVSEDDNFIDFPEAERSETKSKRVQLLVRPSTYKKIHKYLKSRNQSFNDFINQYLEAFIEKKGL